MKEAAGEANMTVITIVLIAIVLGVGTVIVNRLMNNSRSSSDCSAQGNIWYNGKCYTPDNCTVGDDNKTTCKGNLHHFGYLQSPSHYSC